jgi:hypothetical protein
MSSWVETCMVTESVSNCRLQRPELDILYTTVDNSLLQVSIVRTSPSDAEMYMSDFEEQGWSLRKVFWMDDAMRWVKKTWPGVENVTCQVNEDGLKRLFVI